MFRLCFLRALARPFTLALAAATGLCAERPLPLDLAQSRVEVAVHATVDSFIARLQRFSPLIQVDDTGRIVSARFTFAFRDLLTGKPKRDAAMHEWQHTDTFPDGTFVLASFDPAASGNNTFTARGHLTLHGVTRELSFPVTLMRDGDLYVIDGEAPLDTRDFGLPVIRMFAVLKVDPLIRVRFHLQGRSSS